MNIGLLIYDLRSGGAERVLCKWSDLLSRGHKVTLYTFDNSSLPEYKYSGTLTNLNAPSSGRNMLKQVGTTFKRCCKLNKQLKKDKIDVLISFCSTANFPTMFQNVTRAASIRLYAEYFSYKNIYRFLIKYTKTELIVQTQRLKRDILADVGERYAPKIHVIGNPLDGDMIRKKMTECPPNEFLEKIQGKKVICYTASFKTAKNHCNLIKSFYLLYQEIPDVILLLIGGQGEMEEKIHMMVDDSSIRDNVIFAGKTTNPFKYEKYADVFVLPSITEGIPNALIEAMAVGLPVVSTDCPSGPREILFKAPDMSVTTTGIEYADYGILVEPFFGEPDFRMEHLSKQNIVLKDALKSILLNPYLLDHYRKQASIRAQKYDLGEYQKDLERLILDIK